jgi:hypothetical protein
VVDGEGMRQIQLKDGLTTWDPRVDRVPHYDERSRDYRVRTLIDANPRLPKPRVHHPARPSLNQKAEGACVGFSIATGLNASPKRRRPAMTNPQARELYWLAQRNDPWPGGSYAGADPRYEGTSLLAGLQVARRQGLIASFYWCGAGSGTAVDDVVESISKIGGVLFGIRWLECMYLTESGGVVVIDPDSPQVGYHAVWAHSFRYAPLPGRGGRKKIEHVVWQNTWGPSYGAKFHGIPGHGFVTIEDLERHLLPRMFNGEAAVPVKLG